MNKLITDRPSAWKDWLLQMMNEIEEELAGRNDVYCLGLVAMGKDRNGSVVTGYYNAGLNDKMCMKGMIGLDITDAYIKENYDLEDNDLDMGCSDC